MEMSLFKKDREDWTRFKIRIKDFRVLKSILRKYGIDVNNPTKENSRFIYFELKGDFLNVEKK